jgi:transcriptional regulator with XRE-family HTH domain
MGESYRLSENLRSLRRAFGETQEQLAEALHVVKNAVSNYESGARVPNERITKNIADHFMISVEELAYGDYSSIDKILVNKNTFWEKIDGFVPIVTSTKALGNGDFKKAYDAHKAFYSYLALTKQEAFNNIDAFWEGYLVAVKDTDIKAEAAANLLGLWYLVKLMMKSIPYALAKQPAALVQIVNKDKAVRECIESMDSSFLADTKELLEEIDDDETRAFMNELLTFVKKSKGWSELADYYLALQYIWNLVDNDLGWGFNQRIGVEMMKAFANVGNHYASGYFKLIP